LCNRLYRGLTSNTASDPRPRSDPKGDSLESRPWRQGSEVGFPVGEGPESPASLVKDQARSKQVTAVERGEHSRLDCCLSEE